MQHKCMVPRQGWAQAAALGFVVAICGCKLPQQQRRLPLALVALAAEQADDWLQCPFLQHLPLTQRTFKHVAETGKGHTVTEGWHAPEGVLQCGWPIDGCRSKLIAVRHGQQRPEKRCVLHKAQQYEWHDHIGLR